MKKILILLVFIGGCSSNGKVSGVSNKDAVLSCIDMNMKTKKQSVPTGYICQHKKDKNKKYYQMKTNQDLR